ncbi:hypothetical protein [Paracoccus aerius]|nr:hypothetical protein [Paracoccus aerius]GHG37293.1 hypothetical protein GCM10017322_40070 [Paracoccus aerius]
MPCETRELATLLLLMRLFGGIGWPKRHFDPSPDQADGPAGRAAQAFLRVFIMTSPKVKLIIMSILAATMLAGVVTAGLGG